MHRLLGRHAPALLGLLLCTGALSLLLTGTTIVEGGRGGRAWLCRRRGAALSLPVPGLLPDCSTIDQTRRCRGRPWVGGLLFLFSVLSLFLLIFLLFLDSTAPSRTVVVWLGPAIGHAVVLWLDLKVALFRGYEEKHGEFREWNGRRDGRGEAGGA